MILLPPPNFKFTLVLGGIIMASEEAVEVRFP